MPPKRFKDLTEDERKALAQDAELHHSADISKADVLLAEFTGKMAGANYLQDQMLQLGQSNPLIGHYLADSLQKIIKGYEENYKKTRITETTHWKAALQTMTELNNQSGRRIPETMRAIENFASADHAGYPSDQIQNMTNDLLQEIHNRHGDKLKAATTRFASTAKNAPIV